MQIILWGVRGSISNPGPDNRYYGANTPCVELRSDADDLLIFDAGTGIHSLGNSLPQEGLCHLFISHGHNDHCMSLPFFRPVHLPGWKIHLYLPEWLNHLPERIFDGTGFPLRFSELRSAIIVHLLKPGQTLNLEDVASPISISCFAANHPGGSMAFRIDADGEAFLQSGDHEITEDPDVREATLKMLSGITTALVDASFSRARHIKNWGHSSWEDWVDLAEESGVKTLVLSHHAPSQNDADLDAAAEDLRFYKHSGLRACLAREGMNIPISPNFELKTQHSSWIQDFLDSLAKYQDETILLDRILAKTREVTNADAGTFFLRDGEELFFAYSHNESLFPKDSRHKSAYVNMRLPINTKSIAGYVATTRESLNLPDVYKLPDNAPYSFNSSFDRKNGYRTRSVLAMPILSHNQELIGVLQLINSINQRDGRPTAFSSGMEHSIRFLTREAAVFLDLSTQMLKSIRQMMNVVSIHDPTETGPHASRVGSIAAELYQRWAEKRGEEPEKIRYYKSRLRLAAMLHDIGKVGVSDLVLKKKGRLTDEEFSAIRQHTILGAGVFTETEQSQDISRMAYEIALNHHQKWDGTGYPPIEGVRPAGGGIPLSARLTAIADVFDAMVSPRCYKEPWSFERTLEMMREESGRHFDPGLVDILHEIMDTVTMIYERFPDI